VVALARVADAVIGLASHTAWHGRGRPATYPRLDRHAPAIRQHPRAGRCGTDPLLAVLPEQADKAEALARAAIRIAAGRPIVFLYRWATPIPTPLRLPSARNDPALDDPGARQAVVRVEYLVDQVHAVRRYVFLSSAYAPSVVTGLWQTLRPQQTLVVAEDQGLLRGIQADRVYRSIDCAVPVVHYVKHWERC